jgi:transposase InsO family protein
MGTVGNCYDNAPMESFWGSMQVELLYVASGTDLLDDHRAELRCIRVRHGFPFGQPPFSQRKVKSRGTHHVVHQMGYRPTGGADGIRTRDLLVANQQ